MAWYEVFDRWFTNGYGYGRAIVEFMQWEADSGRLEESEWWRAVNAQMLDDMKAAWVAWDNGERASDSETVSNWLQYMANPTQESLWTAHNQSIAAGFKANTALLSDEPPAEQQFALYVTYRVLVLGPKFSSKGPLLDWVTNGMLGVDIFAYPQSYPAQYGIPSVDYPNWLYGR